MRFNSIDWLAFVLVIVGALNWGLVGFFDFDLVASLFGDMSGFTRVIYSLVGLSAVYLAVSVGAKATAGQPAHEH